MRLHLGTLDLTFEVFEFGADIYIYIYIYIVFVPTYILRKSIYIYIYIYILYTSIFYTGNVGYCISIAQCTHTFLLLLLLSEEICSMFKVKVKVQIQSNTQYKSGRHGRCTMRWMRLVFL